MTESKGQQGRYRYQARARFWLSLAATLLQVAVVGIAGLWLLPRYGVRVPLPALAAVALAVVAFDIFTYVMGTRALDRPPATAMEAMAGLRGVVVRPLSPVGQVRVDGELWQARSVEGDIDRGEVTVIGREGLTLNVVKSPAQHGRRSA